MRLCEGLQRMKLNVCVYVCLCVHMYTLANLITVVCGYLVCRDDFKGQVLAGGSYDTGDWHLMGILNNPFASQIPWS